MKDFAKSMQLFAEEIEKTAALLKQLQHGTKPHSKTDNHGLTQPDQRQAKG